MLKKIFFGLFVVICVALLIGLISFPIMIVDAFKDVDLFNTDYQYVDMYIHDRCWELEQGFKENGIEYYQADNTVEEYRQIKHLFREDDVIIYYDTFGEKECNKILQVLGYDGLDDYLTYYNYLDEDGEPDVLKLRESTYERIIKEMSEEDAT